ncbi:MAG: Asp-tRNA(Asn)/Glu-tRNA(Gln) amidotransferase subunit GatC [Patescibacteria group bacterium]|nr:Asp-tRNA(Asn)/Glu-tRNA(Gln) amidotransferase subunit GatC [Patescibacteria group bacterium]
MKLTSDQVKKVAKLSNLPLNQEEEEKYSEQLSKILDYIDQLNLVDTQGVEPTFNVTGLSNIMREDKDGESLSQEEALQNASSKKDGLPAGRQGFFATKGVFEEES